MPSSQFLILLVPDAMKVGGSVRLVGVANSETEAQQRLHNLDASITGRIGVVEVKHVYDRRPAVQNTPVEDALISVND